MRTSAKGGEGVRPDADKGEGGGQFLLYFCGRPLWMTPNMVMESLDSLRVRIIRIAYRHYDFF